MEIKTIKYKSFNVPKTLFNPERVPKNHDIDDEYLEWKRLADKLVDSYRNVKYIKPL